ncbi:hypothetical protein F5050DRAFT_1807650 [Lentinula boryana]|uniref:SAM domain-containing protein n=1 Tax=Lentinula boryana TaxID=40481 RepID=A0ABQ8QDD9_9AGAR|nr:hypothetical protein F5050DRAFT_1807650 [Lentinula boryana]
MLLAGKRKDSSHMLAYDNIEEEEEENIDQLRSSSPLPELPCSRKRTLPSGILATAPSRKKSTKDKDPGLQKIVLMVPRYDKTNERKTYKDRSVDHEDVISDIYDVIGCSNAKDKPSLSYKIEGAPVKSGSISLMTDDDWEGLCDDVLAKQQAKSKIFKVNILVDDDYLNALNQWIAKQEGKIKKIPQKGKNNKKSDKFQSFKFDSESDDNDSSDEKGLTVMDKESRIITELVAMYGNCALCRPKICKIGQGAHVQLTFSMQAAWAASLAREEPGVTIKTPPKTEMFRQFHHTLSSRPSPSNLSPDIGMKTYGSNMSVMTELVVPIVGAFAAASQLTNQRQFTAPETPTPAPHTTHQWHSPQCLDVPFSDSFDEQDLNPYPTISDFLRSLDIAEPQRNLSRYVEVLHTLDFYNIDHISDLSAKTLQDEVGMTLGNAMHVLNMVKKKIRVCDRERKNVPF